MDFSDYQREYKQRTAGHRHPSDVYRDIRRARQDRLPGTALAALALELVDSMEAYQAVIYQP